MSQNLLGFNNIYLLNTNKSIIQILKRMRTPQKIQTYPELYEIERIVGFKYIGTKKFFLIKWVGYSQSQNTWQPQEHITNIQEILEQNKGKIPLHKEQTTELKLEKGKKGKGKYILKKKQKFQKKKSGQVRQKVKIEKQEKFRQRVLKGKSLLGGQNYRKSKLNLRKTILSKNQKSKYALNSKIIKKNSNIKKNRAYSISSQSHQNNITQNHNLLKNTSPKGKSAKQLIKEVYSPSITEQYYSLVLNKPQKQDEEEFKIEQQLKKYVMKSSQSESSDFDDQIRNVPSDLVKGILGTNQSDKKVYQIQLFNGQYAQIHQSNLKKYFPKNFCEYLLEIKQNEQIE